MSVVPELHLKRLKTDLSQKLMSSVTLAVFTQELECDYCRKARELAQDLASLTDKIKVEVYDLVNDKQKASELGVNKVPATVIVGEKGGKETFYGVAGGYEFSALLKDLIQISRAETDLSQETRKALSTFKRAVHIQVFATPTCPYCPEAVSLAHQFAMENPNIRADMIEINEFPQLAIKYTVMGVPKTVINENVEMVGLQPEEELLRLVTIASRPPSLAYA